MPSSIRWHDVVACAPAYLPQRGFIWHSLVPWPNAKQLISFIRAVTLPFNDDVEARSHPRQARHGDGTFLQVGQVQVVLEPASLHSPDGEHVRRLQSGQHHLLDDSLQGAFREPSN